MESSPASSDRLRLRPYLTSESGSVYCLRNLPEEVVAVLFAYYSRSRDSLRDNLLRLLDEGDLEIAGGPPDASDEEARLLAARDKARAFHEKWVIGYGHSSVAEHAVVHVAVEDVSILASKRLEDARLASFTEKSTRYVPFDTRRFHTPAAFSSGAAGAAYAAGIHALMSTYDSLMEPLVAHLFGTVPPRAGQSEKGHQSACRAQACDVLRYLLPAATLTNIGMTVNARALESLLIKLLSSPLNEVREMGASIKREAQKIVPTLIKYAERSEYRSTAEAAHAARALRLLEAIDPSAAPGGTASAEPARRQSSGVRLLRFDPDAELRVVEAMLYGISGRPADVVRLSAASMDVAARQAMIGAWLADRGPYDAPPRALEATDYLFEVVLDYGAYRDIQRHRLAGQYPQRLTPELGSERPEAIEAAGMTAEYDRALADAEVVWRTLSAEHPEDAQYAVPLACRTRLLMQMNLRELHHFVQLRSARQGHRSYRRIAQEMYRAVAEVHPALAAMIRVDLESYDLSRG